MTEREAILAALDTWVRQRSGLDARDYVSDWRDVEGRKALRGDQRTIAQQGRDFRTLFAYVEPREASITAEQLKEGFRAFSGRLSWTPNENGGGHLDYTTGQYFPTEYRAAACAVLASVIWGYFRSDAADGTAIRQRALHTFGRGIQRRWFN